MLARLFIAVGGLLAAALAAMLVAPWFIDWTGYRAAFEAEASRIVGQRVHVRGEARARILPFPSVSFSDVTVDGPDGLPALTAAAFSLDAELAPFISGEIRIFDMRLDRPDIRLSLDASGGLVWPMAEGRGAAPQVSLERLLVSSGRVVIERPAAAAIILTDVDATVSTAAIEGPWRAEGAATLDGTPLDWSLLAARAADAPDWRLRTRLAPRGGLVSGEFDGRLAILEGAPEWRGEAVIDLLPRRPDAAAPDPARRLARIAGPFTADMDGLAVVDARLTAGPAEAPFEADGALSVRFGGDASFAVRLDGRQVRVDELDGTAKGDRVGASAGIGERLAALQAFAASLPVPPIPGRVDLTLPALVVGDTTVRNLAISATPSDKGWGVETYRGELPGRTVIEGSGALETAGGPAFRGTMTLASRQPTGLAAWLGVPLSEATRALAGAGFSARVEIAAGRQVLRDLELQLGEARFSGFIDRQTTPGQRPTLALGLSGADADLDLVSGPAFAVLAAGHDLDIAFRSDGAAFAGLAADGLDAALRVREGTIEIDRFLVTGLEGAQIAATGRWPAATGPGLPGEAGGRIEAELLAADPSALQERLAALFPDAPLIRAGGDRLAALAAMSGNLRATLTAAPAPGGLRLDIAADSDAGRIEAGLTAETGGPLALAGRWTAPGNGPLLLLAGMPDFGLAPAGAMTAEFDLKGQPGAPAGTLRLAGEGGDTLGLDFAAPGTPAAFSVAAADAEPHLLALGYGLPAGGFGLPLSARGTWTRDGTGLRLAIAEGAIAGAAFSGDVTLARGARDRLTGALALPQADLAALLGLAFGGIAQGAGTVPDLPVDADIALSVGRLSAGAALEASDVRLRLAVGPATVSLRDVSAALAGGALTGGMELARLPGGVSLAANGALAGFDAASAAPAARLSGTASLRTDLTASAATVEGLVPALSGSAILTTGDLSLQGVSTAGFAGFLAETDGLAEVPAAAWLEQAARRAFGSGAVTIAPAAASFTISSGVARGQRVSAALGDGGRIDLAADIDLAAGTVSADGALAAAGSDAPLRFRLDGPPAAPRLSLDLSALEGLVTERALAREQAKVDALQSAVAEKQRLRRENRHQENLIAARRAAEAAIIETEKRRRADARAIAEAKAAEAKAAEAAAAEAEAAATAGANAAPAPPPASP